MFVKISSDWLPGTPWVNVNGEWRVALGSWVNVNGTWVKHTHSSDTPCVIKPELTAVSNYYQMGYLIGANGSYISGELGDQLPSWLWLRVPNTSTGTTPVDAQFKSRSNSPITYNGKTLTDPMHAFTLAIRQGQGNKEILVPMMYLTAGQYVLSNQWPASYFVEALREFVHGSLLNDNWYATIIPV